MDEIGSAPIIEKQGATIRVSDLGQVTQGAPDLTLLVMGNGREAVSLSISQQIGANILDLRAGIEQTLADLAHTLPAGLEDHKVYDLGEFVASAITSVRDAILIGGFLAIIVLVVFLRDWRLTLIAALTLRRHRNRRGMERHRSRHCAFPGLLHDHGNRRHHDRPRRGLGNDRARRLFHSRRGFQPHPHGHR